jgi:hypothetical protein
VNAAWKLKERLGETLFNEMNMTGRTYDELTFAEKNLWADYAYSVYCEVLKIQGKTEPEAVSTEYSWGPIVLSGPSGSMKPMILQFYKQDKTYEQELGFPLVPIPEWLVRTKK